MRGITIELLTSVQLVGFSMFCTGSKTVRAHGSWCVPLDGRKRRKSQGTERDAGLLSEHVEALDPGDVPRRNSPLVWFSVDHIPHARDSGEGPPYLSTQHIHIRSAQA